MSLGIVYHYFNKFSSQKDWKAYGSYQSGVDPTLSHCLYLDTEIPSYCFLLFQLQTIYWATWLNTLQPLFCSLTWCVMPSHPSPCRHAQHICALALFKTKKKIHILVIFFLPMKLRMQPACVSQIYELTVPRVSTAEMSVLVPYYCLKRHFFVQVKLIWSVQFSFSRFCFWRDSLGYFCVLC